MNKRHTIIGILGLLAVFVFHELIIWPIGEFPLNDDWAYALTIKQSLENGTIHYHQWMGMSFLIQFLLGWTTSLLLGFSFEHLRWINIVLTFTLWCYFYFMSSKQSSTAKLILLGTLFFNPILVQQSNTFMTDVIHCLLLVFSTHFLQKYFEKRNWNNLIFSLFLGIAALFQKQISILFLLSIPGYFILFEWKKSKKEIALTLSSITISYLALSYFLSLENIKTINMGIQQAYILNNVLHPTLVYGSKFIFYSINAWLSLAVFLLPITILFFLKKSKKHLFISIIIGFISGLFILVKYHVLHEYLPFTGNIMFDLGVGPHVMTGVTDTLPNYVHLGIAFWTILSGVSSAFFIHFILTHWNTLRQHAFAKFSFLFLLGYCGVLALSYFSDRYLLLPLFLIVMVVLKTPLDLPIQSRRGKRFSIISLAIYLFFSLAANHDYFALNRARWSLLASLEKKGIPPTEIDGGFEYNGLHLYTADTTAMTTEPRFWWIKNDTYIVTPALLKNMSVIEFSTYTSYVSFNTQKVFIYKQNSNQ